MLEQLKSGVNLSAVVDSVLLYYVGIIIRYLFVSVTLVPSRPFCKVIYYFTLEEEVRFFWLIHSEQK